MKIKFIAAPLVAGALMVPATLHETMSTKLSYTVP
jgi:hypothetical protein